MKTGATVDEDTAAERLEAAKAAFDKLIADAPTPEVADTRRLLKGYFTDPAFRRAMADIVFQHVEALERSAGPLGGA